jgi:gas vesicle protein
MSFLTGFAIGLGLAILYAPKRGEELRTELSGRISNAADNLSDVTERVRRGVAAAKSPGRTRTTRRRTKAA